MLGDGRIDTLNTQLEQFKLNNQKSQQSLQVLLKDHSQLLEDYKALKKAYEANGVQNGDVGSSETVRHPYALVLVDGNGYIFNDELAKDKEEGGMRAARMLNEAVKEYLRESLPTAKHARVIVRVYADVTGLSKQLAKSKLIGLEKRSLAAFTAGFTRAINLFDFTDALDEEGTRFKIREMFKVGADDPACSHILFAACHDSSYLSSLIPFSGLRDKITLVSGAGFSSDFHQFGLNVTQFPTVFRWSELPSSTPSKPSHKTGGAAPVKANKAARDQVHIPPVPRNIAHAYSASSTFGVDVTSPGSSNGFAENDGMMSWRAKTDNPQLSTTSKQGTVPCKYHQKGFCHFGAKCKFAHPPKNGTSTDQAGQTPQSPTIDRSNISAQLPISTVAGFIPLNKDGQRLDAYIKPPTTDDWAAYNERFQRVKPCNAFHLKRVCTTFNCPFDHSELEPSIRRTLEYVVKNSPCPRRGACRVSDCANGHLCQKDDCVGQKYGCRMKKPELHNVDPKLKSMVPAEDEELSHDGGADIYGEDGEGYGDNMGGGW